MPTSLNSWIEQARRMHVAECASRLGLKTQSPRGASGGACACPACGAERRHTDRHDRRLAVGIRRDGLGWRCHECDASGDSIDLVAYAVCGRRMRDLDRDGRRRVREWFGASAPSPYHAPPTAPASYPHWLEVSSVWAICRRTDEDPDVERYLHSRHVDATAVADLDLARALPVGRSLPGWARSWAQRHRLIVPLVNDHGAMTSVLARAIETTERKSLAPAGYARSGLVMADALARTVLARSTLPVWWSGPQLNVMICEGEVDYLVTSTTWSDVDEFAPATLGIVSGSWTPAVATRIPDGANVIVATDADTAGDKYAAAIAETFHGRSVSLMRLRPGEEGVAA